MSESIHSVAGLTALIRDSLEDRFSGVWVEGEISNHRLPGSGHHYFTLKDPFAQISCVFFKGSASRCPVRLTDGMQVQVYGNLSVYEARGQYQLVVQTVQAKGFGDLQAKFEALKQRLAEEGLFDVARKKPIPPFPRTLGIVTSPTGAAVRDMIHVLSRRSPWLRIVLYPAKVQGDGAAGEIVAGIRHFNETRGEERPDLVLLARGGGSIEDLWSFNEEIVARAIAASEIPVMTGVGHEIDFTIADFVADRREPTPSAAAENAAPDGSTLRRHLERLRGGLSAQTESALSLHRRHLTSLRREVAAHEPGRRLRSLAQSVDHLEERLDYLCAGRVQQCRSDLEAVRRTFVAIHPRRTLDRQAERLLQVGERLHLGFTQALETRRQKLRATGALMQSLSPSSVLGRGYSLTTDEAGRVVTSAAEVSSGQRLRTRLATGEFTSRVE